MSTNALAYSISGSGNPVLFLHGFMEDKSMWEPMVSKLPCTAVCVDLNGHGNSPFRPITPPSIEFMAEQVLQLIEQEKLENLVVVGHSMGGYIALELASKLGSLEHVVLFHSHPWEDSEEKKKDRDRVAQLVATKASTFIREAIPNLFYDKNTNHRSIEKYIDMGNKLTPEAIAWASHAMKNRKDYTALIIQNPEKFSVIAGQYDQLIPISNLEDFCMKHGVSLISFASVGHMSHEENPLQALEALRTIIQEN